MAVTIRPRSREEVRAAWDRVKRLERERQNQEAQRLAGLGLVLRLGEGRALAFRGRHYGVPPVPWELSVLLMEAQDDFNALRQRAKEDPRAVQPHQWKAAYRNISRLFKRAVRPRSRLQRWLWPLLPSPLNRATPVEVGQALGFFLTFLALDAAGEGTALPTPHPGMFPWTSPASPAPSRPGATVGVH